MCTRSLIAMTQIRDIMQKNVITIDLDKTALDASVILKERKISFLVIMKEGKPVGIVTERDIVRKIAANNLTASSVQILEIMSKKFKWVEQDASIEVAIQKMFNSNIRRLLVLENENLVGVITQTDLAELLRSKLLINATMNNIESEKI